MIVLKSTDDFYVGENLSNIITVEVSDNLKEAELRLEFERPDGEKFTSEKLTLDGLKVDYAVPKSVCTCRGQGGVQAVAALGAKIEKSEIVNITICRSINALENMPKESPDLFKYLMNMLREAEARVNSVTAADINGSGNLILTMTNGEQIDVGEVKVVISAVKIDENGDLIVTLSDGTEYNAGRSRAIGIEKVEQTVTSTEDCGENVVTITLTSGETATFKFLNGSRGNGIVKAEQTVKSNENSGTNRFEFTMTDGETASFEVKNGDKGDTGATPKLSVGAVETLSPDEESKATISGTAEEPVLNLSLVKGDTGATPDISIGTVETVKPTESAEATMTGTAENPVLSLKLPQGETGLTPNLSIGTVSTVSPTEEASATMTGTAENPVLNLSIPKGADSDINADGLIESANSYIDSNKGLFPEYVRAIYFGLMQSAGYTNIYDSLTKTGENSINVLSEVTDGSVLPAKIIIPAMNVSLNNIVGALTNHEEIEEIIYEHNITFIMGDFSGCTNLKVAHCPESAFSLGRSFKNTSLERLELNGCIALGNQCFENCPLETLHIPINCSQYKNSFLYSSIKNLTVDNGYAYDFYLQWISRQVTMESVYSIIENLADLTGQDSKTFTCGSSLLNNIDDEHKQMLTDKNWTYA